MPFTSTSSSSKTNLHLQLWSSSSCSPPPPLLLAFTRDVPPRHGIALAGVEYLKNKDVPHKRLLLVNQPPADKKNDAASLELLPACVSPLYRASPFLGAASDNVLHVNKYLGSSRKKILPPHQQQRDDTVVTTLYYAASLLLVRTSASSMPFLSALVRPLAYDIDESPGNKAALLTKNLVDVPQLSPDVVPPALNVVLLSVLPNEGGPGPGGGGDDDAINFFGQRGTCSSIKFVHLIRAFEGSCETINEKAKKDFPEKDFLFAERYAIGRRTPQDTAPKFWYDSARKNGNIDLFHRQENLKVAILKLEEMTERVFRCYYGIDIEKMTNRQQFDILKVEFHKLKHMLQPLTESKSMSMNRLTRDGASAKCKRTIAECTALTCTISAHQQHLKEFAGHVETATFLKSTEKGLNKQASVLAKMSHLLKQFHAMGFPEIEVPPVYAAKKKSIAVFGENELGNAEGGLTGLLRGSDEALDEAAGSSTPDDKPPLEICASDYRVEEVERPDEKWIGIADGKCIRALSRLCAEAMFLIVASASLILSLVAPRKRVSKVRLFQGTSGQRRYCFADKVGIRRCLLDCGGFAMQQQRQTRQSTYWMMGGLS